MVLLLCCACERTSPAAAQLQNLLPAVRSKEVQNASALLWQGERILYAGADGIYSLAANGSEEPVKLLTANQPTLLYPVSDDTLYFIAENADENACLYRFNGSQTETVWEPTAEAPWPFYNDSFTPVLTPEDFFVTETCAVLLYAGEIVSITLNSGEVRHLYGGNYTDTSYSACPLREDDFLFTTHTTTEDGIYRMNAATGEAERIRGLDTADYHIVDYRNVFSIDGEVYYTTVFPSKLWRMDKQNRADTCLLSSDDFGGEDISFSYYLSGNELYILCRDRNETSEQYPAQVLRYDLVTDTLTEGGEIQLPNLYGACVLGDTLFYDDYKPSESAPIITVKSVRLPFADG